MRPRFVSSLLLGLLLLVGCSGPQFHAPSGLTMVPTFVEGALLMSDGYALPVREYLPNTTRALVIALHGFNDYSNAFAGFCEYMQQRDVACVAYDQRGFGASAQAGFWPQSGQHERDLEAVLALYAQRYPSLPIYVAGESMGGAVLISALAGRPVWSERVEGVILFAPAVWGRETQPWYQRLALWLTVQTVPGWTPTGRGLGRIASDNVEALRALGRDPLVIKQTRIDAIYGLTNLMDRALAKVAELRHPTLYLYGENDQIIPKNASCRALKMMRQAEVPVDFILYPQGYHMLTRDLQAEKVFSDVLDWLTNSHDKAGKIGLSAVKNYCL